MLPAATLKLSRVIIGILSVVLCMIASKGVVAERLRCEKRVSILNGSVRYKRISMKVSCNNGYNLLGLKTIDCVRGKWDGEKPVCARKGCPKNVATPANGRLQIESDLKAILYCSDNYSVAGNRYMYCNGTHWDRPIGSCRERTGKVTHECDFETEDVCGWSFEPMANLQWKRVMAVNVFDSFKTGPRHDHTTLTHNGGHYMLMESLVRQDMLVTLTSPIYDRELSLKTACCFQFYYFMYGLGVGDLLVVVKPVSTSLDEILLSEYDLIKFSKNGNQNNIWNEAHFSIEELEEDFQIVFVAKSGSNQLSDIAVDDVRLLTGEECKAFGIADKTISNEDLDATTEAALYEIQSCVGRCFNTSVVGITRTGGHLKGLCSCGEECEDADTCCPDFRAVCLNELFESSTVDSATSADAETPASTTVNSTTKSTTTTSKKVATTAKIPQTTDSTTTTSLRTEPTTRQTTTTTRKPTTTMAPTTTTTAKPTSTTQKTTPTTTATTTTTVRTTTSTTPKPTPPTTTTVRTTKATTTRTTTTARPTTTTTTTSTTTTTARPTTTAKATRPTEPTTLYVDTSRNSRVKTPNQKPVAKANSTSYVIDSDPKVEAAHKGSSVLTWTLILIVIIVLGGLAYRRYGNHAVAWYMIHFSKSNGGGEETSTITASFKRPSSTAPKDERTSKAKSRKKAAYANEYKRPLVEDDDDDDDNSACNGNIALTKSIYTEL